MVQRKVPNKLCIQTDLHVKSDKRLGNLRPSSPKHQDGKNKGSDLKKKMKKSRSITHTDFESLKSHTFIREVAQPGKPPPQPQPPLAVSTPQKQSPVKGSYASPNYMKSTSSFDARKERSQVSSKSSQSSAESKSPKKVSNNSRLSSVSDHKPGKTLTRTSSLKLVRNLTKSPSFKPLRVSTKKCSQVVLCENLEVQRATCSSTLKDSKFPTYLTLSPGATESEGTSAMEVCPYTYCSLNGHRHAPLPPLKCFLKARRRVLKAQKSMKLGCLSPRRVKPSGDGVKENSKQIIVDEIPAIQGTVSNGPGIIQEEQVDFFIQIYAGNHEDAAENLAGKEGNGDEDEEIDIVENGGGKVDERCSNETLGCEINSGDSLWEVVSPELEAAEEVYSASPTQEEEKPESLSCGTDSEDSDMEWEEGQHSSTLSPDEEMGYSSQTDNGYDLESGSLFGDDIASFCKEPVFKSDDIVSSGFDEISADEGLEGFFQEEESDSEGSYQNLGSGESLQAFNKAEESTAEGRDGNNESSANTEDFHIEGTVVENLVAKTEDPGTKQSLQQKLLIADAGDATYEEDHEDTANSLIGIPSFDLLQDLFGADKGMTKEDANEIKFGAAAKEGELNQTSTSEALQNSNDDECQNKSEKDHHEAWSFKISHSMDSENQTHSGLNKVIVAENSAEDANEMEVEYSTMSDPEETLTRSWWNQGSSTHGTQITCPLSRTQKQKRLISGIK